ncbi:hypothetical protein KW786_01120 [Candidatus Parcubacteria bacterium]|nr:hypothetical protein [Candidatus Parcubacteria bacterium]
MASKNIDLSRAPKGQIAPPSSASVAKNRSFGKPETPAAARQERDIGRAARREGRSYQDLPSDGLEPRNNQQWADKADLSRAPASVFSAFSNGATSAVQDIAGKAVQKAQQKLKDQFKKLLKTYGWGFIIKGVPIIGDFWPGFTIRALDEVWPEWRKWIGLKPTSLKDSSLTSPDSVIMLPTAVFFDGLMLAVGVLGDWWGFSDYGTVGWFGWFVFGVWIWMRSGGLTGFKGDEGAKEDQKKADASKPKTPEEQAEDAKNGKGKKSGKDDYKSKAPSTKGIESPSKGSSGMKMPGSGKR